MRRYWVIFPFSLLHLKLLSLWILHVRLGLQLIEILLHSLYGQVQYINSRLVWQSRLIVNYCSAAEMPWWWSMSMTMIITANHDIYHNPNIHQNIYDHCQWHGPPVPRKSQMAFIGNNSCMHKCEVMTLSTGGERTAGNLKWNTFCFAVLWKKILAFALYNSIACSRMIHDVIKAHPSL